MTECVKNFINVNLNLVKSEWMNEWINELYLF